MNKPLQAPAKIEYIVSDKKVESDQIVSFSLKPKNGECPNYEAGSYLVFDVPAGVNGGIIQREYSISNWSKDKLRVTIKRESAPDDNATAPAGLVSSYFQDKIQNSDSIMAYGPAGKFLLDKSSKRPVVLLSGGVGQTPLVAMAHALAEQATRKTIFIHACENSQQHAMADEIAAIKKDYANFSTHTCFAKPLDSDVLGQNFDSAGFVTKSVLQFLLPVDDYEVYLCGPGAFMQAMFDLLLSLGVSESRINYEFFGEASLLKSTASSVTKTTDKTNMPVDENSKFPMVSFAKSGLTVAWDPEIENLLEFAEEQELMPDFSCRSGTCESCMVALKSGEISYAMEPMLRPEAGNVLLCCAIPTTDIVLDL